MSAAKVNLLYDAVLKYGPKIDPVAYRVVEDIWYKECQQLEWPWDFKGRYGVSPELIAQVWRISGFKNTPKYRKIVSFLFDSGVGALDFETGKKAVEKINRGWSFKKTKLYLNGAMFLIKRKQDLSRFKNSQIIQIGRIKDLAAKKVLMEEKDIYSAYKLLKLPKKERSRYLGTKEAWYYLYKRVPQGLPIKKETHPYHLSPKLFMELMRRFGEDRDAMTLPIFRLSVVFNHMGAVKQLLKKLGLKLDKKGIHDAGQFVLPQSLDWNPRKWEPFVLKYPASLKYASYFGDVEKIGFPKNYRELKRMVASFSYKNIENKELAELCFDLGVSQHYFVKYQELAKKKKNAESLPFVEVRGDEVGLKSDWRFYKLEFDDLRGPLLGLYTNCCQHLASAAASCAIAGYSSIYSGFYVVEKNGKIVAQSWAWRGAKGELVFDSIESVSDEYSGQIAKLYLKAAQKLLGKLCVTRVMVGDTIYGVTHKVKKELGVADCALEYAEMIEAVSYSDAGSQWVLAEQNGIAVEIKIDKILKKKTGLQPGSGVYCEFCDAEVHPECETCPECGMDISEWIEDEEAEGIPVINIDYEDIPF